MTFTLIFISFFIHGASVLTQSGFTSRENCENAGKEMVVRALQYNPGIQIEWVCK